MAVAAPHSAGTSRPTQELAGGTDAPSDTNRRSFRTDIDGLRALAVGLVVLFHAEVPGFGGGFVGVDVFFVISGFLITQGLLAERDRSGRIDIVGFWLRRARRLLPAAGLMIASVVVAQLFLRSPLGWDTAIGEGIAAATYWSNEQVAGIAGGYFGARVESRALLHTWSLSVEEQFYIVWPLVFAGLSVGVVRRARSALLVAFLVLSVVWCAQLTLSGQAGAYFGAASRAWEFLVGVVVALVWKDLRAAVVDRPVVRNMVGVAGLALILGAGLWFGRGQGFPWPGALLPVIGTAAVLVAKFEPSGGIGRVLALQPMQWLGRVSYSWYLWHWPFLVLGREWLDREDLATAVGLVAASLGVAFLSYRFVETPYRHRLAETRIGEVVGALVVPLSVTLAVIGGAAGYRAVVFSDPFVAAVEEAADGWPTHLAGCYSLEVPDFDERCVFGQANAETTVLVIGDSHAAHWMPAFDVIGRNNDLRVVALQIGNCPVLAPASVGGDTPPCEKLRVELGTALDVLEPALVISSTSEVYVERDSADLVAWQEGHGRFASELADAGIGFLVFHDIGRWETDPLECLLADRSDSCGLDRRGVERHRQPVALAERLALEQAGHGATFDPLTILCGESECLPVSAGGDIVMQDSHHITRSFAAILAPEVESVVLNALAS